MNIKRETWQDRTGLPVWVGRYRNSHNLPHWHYECELFYVEKGSIEVFCERKTYLVKAGESFFIDSRQVHCMHAATKDTTVAMIVFENGVTGFFAHGSTLACPLLGDRYDVYGLFCTLRSELEKKEKLYEGHTALLVSQLMMEVFRNEETKPPESSPTAERFRSLLNEMEQKFEFFDLGEAAAYMGMNPSYFSRLFHKQTRMTFSHYLNFIKVQKAVDLLQKDPSLTVTEVAIQSGFNTIRNFNRIFRAYTGYTPKELPENFLLVNEMSDRDDDSADPTLYECTLLESSDPAEANKSPSAV